MFIEYDTYRINTDVVCLINRKQKQRWEKQIEKDQNKLLLIINKKLSRPEKFTILKETLLKNKVFRVKINVTR